MLKLVLLLVVVAFTVPINGLHQRNLEDETIMCGGCPCNIPCVQSPPPPIMCGGCPCNIPCVQSPPPPPPPSPPPPAPKPPSINCPPPPPPPCVGACNMPPCVGACNMPPCVGACNMPPCVGACNIPSAPFSLNSITGNVYPVYSKAAGRGFTARFPIMMCFLLLAFQALK